jgi:hypothetical protein
VQPFGAAKADGTDKARPSPGAVCDSIAVWPPEQVTEREWPAHEWLHGKIIEHRDLT